MANRFQGSYRSSDPKTRTVNGRPSGPRGVARELRQTKRFEAELRNELTPTWRTRQHRRTCALGDGAAHGPICEMYNK